MNNTNLISVNIVQNLSERKEQEEWDTANFKDDRQELLQLEKWKEQTINIMKGSPLANKWQLQHTYEHLRNMNNNEANGPEINMKILDWVLAEEEEDDTKGGNARKLIRNKYTNRKNNEDYKESEEDSLYHQRDRGLKVNAQGCINFTQTNTGLHVKNQLVARKSPSSQQDKTRSNSETAAAAPVTKLSSAYIERTLNKQLLNNLLLQRIQSKFHKIQETKNALSNLSTIANSDSHTNDRNTIGEILEKEVSNFQQKALNSFKNVGRQFGRLGAIIESKQLFKEAVNSIHAPQGIRAHTGKNKNEGLTESIKESKSSTNFHPHLNKQTSNFTKSNGIFSNEEIRFKDVELAFKNNYNKALLVTQNLKKKIIQERIRVSDLGEQLTQAQESKNHQLNLLDAEETALKKELFSKSVKQRILEMKNLSDQFFTKRELVTSQAQKICSSLSSETLRINEAIQKLQNNLVQAKIKKNTAANILKDLYFQSLSGKSPSKDLIEIVKELLLLNEGQALDTSLFPSSLDKKSIDFLITWGKLLIEIEIARDSLALHGRNIHQSVSFEGQKDEFNINGSNTSKFDERNQQKRSLNMNQCSNSQNNQNNDKSFSNNQKNNEFFEFRTTSCSSPTSNQTSWCQSATSPVNKSIFYSPKNSIINNTSLNYRLNCEDVKDTMHQLSKSQVLQHQRSQSSNEGEFLMDSLIESRMDDEENKKSTYNSNQKISWKPQDYMHDSSSMIQSRHQRPECHECQALRIQYCELIRQESKLKKNEMKRVDYSKNVLILLFGLYEGQTIYNQHILELEQSQANKSNTASFNFNQIPLKNTNRPPASICIHKNISMQRDNLNNLTFQKQRQEQPLGGRVNEEQLFNHKMLILPNSTIKIFQSKKYFLNNSSQQIRHFRNNSCYLFSQGEQQSSPSVAYSDQGNIKSKKVPLFQQNPAKFSKYKNIQLQRSNSNTNLTSKI